MPENPVIQKNEKGYQLLRKLVAPDTAVLAGARNSSVDAFKENFWVSRKDNIIIIIDVELFLKPLRRSIYTYLVEIIILWRERI